MRYSLAFVGLFAAGALVALANNPRTTARRSPESLLPPGCIAYFAYDGYASHREAYDKTALAKVMKDDAGEFVEHVFSQLTEFLAKELESEQPPDDGDAEDLKPAKAPFDPAMLTRFFEYVWSHGVHVGVEAIPQGKDGEWEYQATVVSPEAGIGANGVAAEALLRWLVAQGKGEVREGQHGKYAVVNFEIAG